jgi:hypothetical protein
MNHVAIAAPLRQLTEVWRQIADTVHILRLAGENSPTRIPGSVRSTGQITIAFRTGIERRTEQ